MLQSDTRLIEIFTSINQINCLSENEKEMAEFVEKFATSLGYSVVYDDAAQYTNSNTGNVIITSGEGGDFALISHLDTARETANVKTVFHEDRLTSGGDTPLGVDDRVGVATLLRVLELNAAQGMKDITVAFTTCEETTLLGSVNLKLPEKVKECFIFDSYKDPGTIINRAYGAMGFNVEIKGRASHSGIAPEKGIHSIKAAAAAVAEIPCGRKGDTITVNIGTFTGGTAVNVVPAHTKLEGEVRSPFKNLVEEEIANIKTIFEKHCAEHGAELKFESRWDFEPYIIEQNHGTYTRAAEAIAKAGLTPVASDSWGGSDANSLNAKGIPTLNLGTGARNPHGDDEYIMLEHFYSDLAIAKALIGVN